MELKINTINSIKNGELEQLNWGSSKIDMETLFGKTKKINYDLFKRNYPYLDIDGVEFHFDDYDFSDLSQVIIQAWRINKNSETIMFNHEWICKDFTFSLVKNKLTEIEMAFTIDNNRIITESGSCFLFYETGESIENEELCKIVLDRNS